MNASERIKGHNLFRVERVGDAIVVSPHADVGSYSTHEFKTELQTTAEMLDLPGIKSMVVDLGDANYFGSEMIGALNSLRRNVVDRGGRFAACNASVDMQHGLRIMGLDQIWDYHDSRRLALKRAARVTPLQWLVLKRRAITGTCAIVAVVAAVFFVPWRRIIFEVAGNSDYDDYHTLVSIYQDHKQHDGFEAAKLIARRDDRDRSAKQLRSMIKRWKPYAGPKHKSSQLLMFATRDFLLPLIEDGRVDNPPATEAGFLVMFERARQRIAWETGMNPESVFDAELVRQSGWTAAALMADDQGPSADGGSPAE